MRRFQKEVCGANARAVPGLGGGGGFGVPGLDEDPGARPHKAIQQNCCPREQLSPWPVVQSG